MPFYTKSKEKASKLEIMTIRDERWKRWLGHAHKVPLKYDSQIITEVPIKRARKNKKIKEKDHKTMMRKNSATQIKNSQGVI